MAHFYGSVQGDKGEVHRLGTKNSGMSATVASWEGAVTVDAWHDKETGKDTVIVAKKPWNGAGESRVLYTGAIGKLKEVV